MKRFHLMMMGVWALLLIPTVVWWNQSILWLCFMSIYACFSGHMEAYETAKGNE